MGALIVPLLLGPLGAQAQPRLEEGERTQRRMELRRHLMHERERWLAEQGADEGLPEHRRQALRRHLMLERERWRAAQGLPSLPREAGEGAVPPSPGDPAPRGPDARPERLSADERRALRRAISQAYPGNVGASVP